MEDGIIILLFLFLGVGIVHFFFFKNAGYFCRKEKQNTEGLLLFLRSCLFNCKCLAAIQQLVLRINLPLPNHSRNRVYCS